MELSNMDPPRQWVGTGAAGQEATNLSFSIAWGHHPRAQRIAAPVSTWKTVVFPAPFTPSRPKHSPCPTMALIPVTALTGGRPRPTGYDFFKPSNSTGY